MDLGLFEWQNFRLWCSLLNYNNTFNIVCMCNHSCVLPLNSTSELNCSHILCICHLAWSVCLETYNNRSSWLFDTHPPLFLSNLTTTVSNTKNRTLCWRWNFDPIKKFLADLEGNQAQRSWICNENFRWWLHNHSRFPTRKLNFIAAAAANTSCSLENTLNLPLKNKKAQQAQAHI